MDISYVVVGDTRRKHAALELSDQLSASLALDVEGRWGPGVNHLRAWVLGMTEECDWICVLEDDAVLCENFLVEAEKALQNAPTSVVSFYLGTNYPPAVAERSSHEVEEAERDGRDWILMESMNHAVAIAIRTDVVGNMLQQVSDLVRMQLPIDDAIGHWAMINNIPVAYTAASLVDHLDEPSIIQHPDGVERELPRKAIRFRS